MQAFIDFWLSNMNNLVVQVKGAQILINKYR